MAENAMRNHHLEFDLMAMYAKQNLGATWWRSFGFASSWQEHGFTIRCDADAAVSLARKYDQGAIFSYCQPTPADIVRHPNALFVRYTIPVCLPGSGARTVVEACLEPELLTANPKFLVPQRRPGQFRLAHPGDR